MTHAAFDLRWTSLIEFYKWDDGQTDVGLYLIYNEYNNI